MELDIVSFGSIIIIMPIDLNILEILEYNKPPIEPDVHLSVHPALPQVSKKSHFIPLHFHQSFY